MPPGAEMPESLGMLPGQFNHMDASSDGHYGQGADSAQYLAAILGHPVLASR